MPVHGFVDRNVIFCWTWEFILVKSPPNLYRSPKYLFRSVWVVPLKSMEDVFFCTSHGSSPWFLGAYIDWRVLMKSRSWAGRWPCAESQPNGTPALGLWLLCTGLRGAHLSSAVSGGGMSAHHLQNSLLAAALTREMVQWDLRSLSVWRRFKQVMTLNLIFLRIVCELHEL